MKIKRRCIFTILFSILLITNLSACEDVQSIALDTADNICIILSLCKDVRSSELNAAGGTFTGNNTAVSESIDDKPDTVDNTIENYFLKKYGTSVIKKYDAANNANIEFAAVKNNLSLSFKFGDYKNIKEADVSIYYYADYVLMSYINSDGLDIINGIESNMGIECPLVTVKMINSDGTEIYVHDFTKYEFTDPAEPYVEKILISLEEFVKKDKKRKLVVFGSGPIGGSHTFIKELSIEGNVLVATNYCSDIFNINQIKAFESYYNNYPENFMEEIEELFDELENEVDISDPVIKVKYIVRADYTKAKVLVIEKEYDRNAVNSILGKN